MDKKNFFEKQFTFDRVVRIIISIIIILAILFILDYLSAILIPFVIALILAYLMNPFVNLLQRLVKKRFIAVLLSLVILFGGITTVIVILVPIITNEVTHMGELVQDLVSESDLQAEIETYLPENIADKVKNFIVSKDFQKLFEGNEVGDLSNFVAKKILPTIGNLFSETINVVLGILSLAIVILYLIFLLIDYNDVVAEWKTLIPPKYKNMVLGFLHDFEVAMNKYFRAQMLIATIVGVLFSIGFTIIGLPMGIVLGIFIGMLNMIPYMQNIALIPAIFLALMKSLETGSNLWVILGLVLLVFLVIQIIQDAVLVPKIMGDAIGLNPAVILLSLSIWGKMLGTLGLLIALPITYLIISYYRRFINNSHKIEGPSRIPEEDLRRR